MMMKQSLVIIMAVGPQHKHQYSIVKDAVNQPVFLGDSPAPSTLWLSFQGLGVTSACLGMFHQFNKHLCHFLESLWLIVLQLLHVRLCLVSVIKSIHDNQRLLRKWFNSSTELMRWVLPWRYSSSPLSRLARNSSLEISVGSFCFSATSLRRYFATRFSMLSSSARVPRLRSISAFNCTDVISLNCFFAAKISIKSEISSKKILKKLWTTIK